MITYIIVSLVMFCILVSATFMFKYASKKEANNFLGFRTKKSSSSEQMWAFANNYCAKVLGKLIILYIIIDFLGFLYICINNITDDTQLENITTIPAILTIVILFITILITQVKISK